MNPEQLNEAGLLEAATGMVGSAYDYVGILRLAWLILTGQRTHAPSRHCSHVFCSTYVQKAYRGGGVDLTKFQDDVVEPGDFARLSTLRLVGQLGVPLL